MFARILCTLLCCASFLLAQTPVLNDGGTVNGASFAPGQAVAPGTLVSVFGTDLASALALADTIPLSITMNDVQVSFNGVPAPLRFISPRQINAQVPWNVLPEGVTNGAVPVVVTRGSVTSNIAMVQVGPYSPGIFSTNGSSGYAIAINSADGSVAAPAGAITGLTTHPAKVGDVLEVLATGLGAVDHPIADGANSLDTLRHTTTTPTVLIGGQPAEVQFSGLTPQFVGVNQLNVVVPGVAAGNSIPIQIDVGGIRSTDQVVIAVGP